MAPLYDPGYLGGPCSLWASVEEVAACCGDLSTDESIYEDALAAASQLLFELTLRRFSGSCQSTARPCRDSCSCWSAQRLAYAGGGSRAIFWDGASWQGVDCGCGCLSQVKLAGYPVRSIVEVKIDGAVLSPSLYRLVERRYLTRLGGERWPACQDLSLPDTEPGTWSVTYEHGSDPPMAGRMAAAELACQLYRACAGEECALPSGVTRISRQGIVVERQPFASWAFRERAWRSGLPLVDAFLNAYNPSGMQRLPVFWAPGEPRYARRL